ncbi:Acb2/Tad1 domain-containing protein [Nocardiopsis synnemataformans]|uniref:Acb2/Tad1 domain-containing protein n=1 Tax=Nocardiopsis synnemataformans TaxID=61305 RepID=UPI003EB86BDF
MANPQAPGAVTGYQQHPQEIIDLVNRVKAAENMIGDLVAEIRERKDVDQRMLGLGRNDLQMGFMRVVRSVFQPESRL